MLLLYMLKIRLLKTGKRNAPSFRIVVMPERYPRDGKALEVLGHFNPSVRPPTFSLDKKRLEHWLAHGAQMTEAVKKLAEGKYEFKPYRPKVAKATKAVREKPATTPVPDGTGQAETQKEEAPKEE